MEEFVLQVGGGAVQLDDGVFAGTLVKMEPFTFDHADGPRQLLRWTFSLDDYETGDQRVEVEGVSSMALGPKSKAYQWLTALLGAEKMLERPALRSSDLLGRECLVEITHNAEGYPRVKSVLARPKRARREAA